MQNSAALIQATFVCVLAAVAWFRPLPRTRQLRVSLLALIALVAIALVQLSRRWLDPAVSLILRDWLPAALMLVPYWQIGCFFTKSDPGMEARLATFDRALFRSLGIETCKISIGRVAGVYLELAYLMVYPLIPLGLVALYVTGLRRFVDYYWIVVLLSTYACFAITPFVPAMPPRLRSDYPKFGVPPSRIEAVNRWVLRGASIQAITFPSAHVSSALAVALVLLRLDPWVGGVFLFIALSIAAATIVGGYHYAADVLLAMLVSLLVFSGTLQVLKTG